ncbi:MAG: EF-hand domain-containing protein [Pseudoxanthomonas sp.]|nr:EF-hand domain-containing protein [Pseudoxanthomonas sp.]
MVSHRRIRSLPALFLAPALATPLVAGSLPGSPEEYLARMDVDGDGVIGLAEYRDYLSRGFRRMDLDGNGVLEAAELPVPGARAVLLRDHLDALERSFRRMDRNGDGVLDAKELAAPP